MFSESAELYDLIYDEFKDYAAEATRIAELIRELRRDARSLLDIGCGTGQHARLWTAEHGFQVDGLDLDSGLLELARERCPDGSFTVADMQDFSLDRRYDVVLSMFSSIGYVTTYEGIVDTARCIAAHLAEGGIAIVEPWFTPDAFHSGRFFLATADRPEIKIARTSYNTVEGDISTLHFHYLVTNAEGTRHLEEVHRLRLTSHDEMRRAFQQGGLGVARWDPEGPTGRGLWVLEG